MTQFAEYKAEYSNKSTTRERQQELINLMQQDLKERNNTGQEIINCLDGKEHSINSNSVNDLYAIDGALRSNDSSQKMDAIANVKREVASNHNKYGPDNPYPNK